MPQKQAEGASCRIDLTNCSGKIIVPVRNNLHPGIQLALIRARGRGPQRIGGIPSGLRMPQQKPDVRILKWPCLSERVSDKNEKSSRETLPAR